MALLLLVDPHAVTVLKAVSPYTEVKVKHINLWVDIWCLISDRFNPHKETLNSAQLELGTYDNSFLPTQSLQMDTGGVAASIQQQSGKSTSGFAYNAWWKKVSWI